MSVELDDVLLPIHRKSVKERQRWQGAIQQQHLPHSVLRELLAADDAQATARCKRLSAVLMWLEGVELNRLEASLLVHLPGDDAAGPIRAVADRTRDLIGVVSRIGTLVSAAGTEPIAEMIPLEARLELGIPMDLVPLATAVKRDLERGDYLRLRRAGIKTPEAVLAAEERQLLTVLGSEVKVRRLLERLARTPAVGAANVDLPMPTPATGPNA